MAWNSNNNKDLRNISEKAMSNPGAPIAFDTQRAGKPYKDGWDIERAYRDGMQKVTWVFRCIDAIAGNQARLPVILRKGNDQRGKKQKATNPYQKFLTQNQMRAKILLLLGTESQHNF